MTKVLKDLKFWKKSNKKTLTYEETLQQARDIQSSQDRLIKTPKSHIRVEKTDVSSLNAKVPVVMTSIDNESMDEILLRDINNLNNRDVEYPKSEYMNRSIALLKDMDNARPNSHNGDLDAMSVKDHSLKKLVWKWKEEDKAVLVQNKSNKQKVKQNEVMIKLLQKEISNLTEKHETLTFKIEELSTSSKWKSDVSDLL